MRVSICPRLLLAAVAVLGTIVVGAARADESADAARIDIQIEEKIAALNIKPPTIELTSEKAARVRQAIAQSDYSTASAIIEEVLTESRIQNWRYYPFSEFIEEISDLKNPDFEAHLTDWVSKDISKGKGDAVPLLLRARFYYEFGWHIRGEGFAAATPQSHLDTFANYMAKANADVAAALKLNGDLPYGYYLQLLVLQSHGASQEMTDAFDAAIIKYPNYYPLYDIMLKTRQPRWSGSVPDMYKFVNKYAGGAPANSPLKLLYVDLYQYLLSTAEVNCSAARPNAQASSGALAGFFAWLFSGNTGGSSADRLRDCIGKTMGSFVTPQLEQNVRAALALYDNTDKHQFDAAIAPLLTAMLKIPSGGAYAGTMLQLAATAMHTNTQLHEEEPGQNDYVIDEAVGLSWYQQNFYLNALTKYEEAVKDAASAAFPNAEEKALAIASIYKKEADAAYKLARYVDSIALEKTAMAVDDRGDDGIWICASYYQLKDYEDAISACTDAVNKTDNVNARYWRGISYQGAGKPDAAVDDFVAVVDSTSSFRTSAATALTLIYFSRKDITSAMQVYEAHPFIFDTSKETGSNLAISFNNRCYAYMKLGALQKALDDCTQSLKYGNIPDAFRKQQDLVKRLKAQ